MFVIPVDKDLSNIIYLEHTLAGFNQDNLYSKLHSYIVWLEALKDFLSLLLLIQLQILQLFVLLSEIIKWYFLEWKFFCSTGITIKKILS